MHKARLGTRWVVGDTRASKQLNPPAIPSCWLYTINSVSPSNLTSSCVAMGPYTRSNSRLCSLPSTSIRRPDWSGRQRTQLVPLCGRMRQYTRICRNPMRARVGGGAGRQTVQDKPQQGLLGAIFLMNTLVQKSRLSQVQGTTHSLTCIAAHRQSCCPGSPVVQAPHSRCP